MIDFSIMWLDFAKEQRKRTISLNFSVGRFIVFISVPLDKFRDDGRLISGCGEGLLFIQTAPDIAQEEQMVEEAAKSSNPQGIIADFVDSHLNEMEAPTTSCFGEQTVLATPENIAQAFTWCLKNQQPNN